MDLVLARGEAEEGAESDDLLLQQEKAEERKTDGRDAEESEGRREQAHGPSVPPEVIDASSRPHCRGMGEALGPFPYSSCEGPKDFTRTSVPAQDARRHRRVRGPRARGPRVVVPERHAEGRELRARRAGRRGDRRPSLTLGPQGEDRPPLPAVRRDDGDARTGAAEPGTLPRSGGQHG